MTSRSMPVTLSALLLGLCPCAQAADSYRIGIGAEAFDRTAQTVEFTLPENAPPSPALRDARGQPVGLQMDDRRRGRFVIESQKGGEVLSFVLRSGPAAASPAVRVTQDGREIRAESGGRPVLVYQLTDAALPRAGILPLHRRAGYMHPVFAPSGEIVTDDYPVRNTHHHGIWAAWSKTTFQGRTPNFWDPKEASGTVEFAGVERVWSGEADGGFVVRLRYVDLSAPGGKRTALHETWDVRVLPPVAAGTTRVHIFDVTVTHECAGADPLTVGEYRYGGVGFRGRTEWVKRENARVLTADGETDRLKANAAKARWIFFGGTVGAGHAGIAMLDHPGNFRAPQALRVNEGVPFVCYSPSQEGPWTIEPGRAYVNRYRFVIEDAIPTRAHIDALWNAFAHRAKVDIEAMR